MKRSVDPAGWLARNIRTGFRFKWHRLQPTLIVRVFNLTDLGLNLFDKGVDRSQGSADASWESYDHLARADLATATDLDMLVTLRHGPDPVADLLLHLVVGLNPEE